MSKKNNGITLIALVITIIILLILAGVTISLVLGEHGIFHVAINATDKAEVAQQQEYNSLAQYEQEINKYIKVAKNDTFFEDRLSEVCDILNFTLNFNDLYKADSLRNKVNQDIIIEGPNLNTDDGNAFASAEYSGLPAWNAFCSTASRYNSGSTTKYPNIGYDFSEPVIISSVEIKNYGSDDTAIKRFNIQYSNDKLSWNNANDEVINIDKGEDKLVTFNPQEARYWQIEILENYGYSGYNCSLDLIKFNGIKITETESKNNYWGDDVKANYMANILIDNGVDKIRLTDLKANARFMKEVAKSEEAQIYIMNNAPDFLELMTENIKLEDLELCNPIMTSNILPKGRITCSSYHYEEVRAFDESKLTGWTPATNENPEDSFIQYEFDEPVLCSVLKLVWGHESGKISFSYVVQASNDGLNFIDITPIQKYEDDKIDIITLKNRTKYKYYRMQVTEGEGPLHDASLYSVWLCDFRIFGFK